MKSFNHKKIWKYIFGISGILIVICVTVLMTGIGLSNAKVGNYQLSATNCFQSGKVDGDACVHLRKFGVSSQLYLSDKNYRDSVDELYRDVIKRNAKVAPQLAQFTLEHAFKKRIQLAVEVVEQLRELAKEE